MCRTTLQVAISHVLAAHGALVFALMMTTRQCASVLLSSLLFGHALTLMQWCEQMRGSPITTITTASTATPHFHCMYLLERGLMRPQPPCARDHLAPPTPLVLIPGAQRP